MNETINSSYQTAPQGKNKVDSKWLKVSVEHLEKTADSLKKYAEKNKAKVAPKIKKGK